MGLTGSQAEKIIVVVEGYIGTGPAWAADGGGQALPAKAREAPIWVREGPEYILIEYLRPRPAVPRGPGGPAPG
jgi:hypothetical protein